jgi:hypothetical protein
MFWTRLIILFCLASSASAADTSTATEDFLRDTFSSPPAAHDLWLTGGLRPVVRDILHHDYPLAQVKYWRLGTRSAWVLDEIGKERPITVGIVIDHDRIERVRVLVYRESRGWEVQSPRFTAQFDGAGLEAETQLDRTIDGISGATLSVRALHRLARLALLLHQRALAGEQP